MYISARGETSMRFVAVAILVVMLAACTQLSQRARPPAIQLFAMDCGHIHLSDADSYADDGSLAGQARDLVDPCYLIRHPNGDLIWDTGMGDALHDLPGGVKGSSYQITVPTTLVDQLAQLNLTPDDIEFLSLSHSHFDHVGNAALFTRATWIVDADERAWMFRPEARTDEDFAKVAPLENFHTILITGAKDYDVFGDGSVEIVQAPGHTPGHCVLLVRLARAGPVLLAGDMWHLAESRVRRLVPRFNTDRAQTLTSMDTLGALAARTHARIIAQHVPDDFAALPQFPAAMN
jgi:N-acyl homoserine lactone hydrolase